MQATAFYPETADQRTRQVVADMLTPFFNGWRGDASEPALPAPIINRPAPAAARELVTA